MSDREKRKLLMKEAPEIFGLIEDFKSDFLLLCYLVLYDIYYNYLIYSSPHEKRTRKIVSSLEIGQVWRCNKN